MVLHGHTINKIGSFGYMNLKKKLMKKEEVDNYLHQKIEKGETVSPILPEGIKNYLIDIDGTICDDVPNVVIPAVPILLQATSPMLNLFVLG